MSDAAELTDLKVEVAKLVLCQENAQKSSTEMADRICKKIDEVSKHLHKRCDSIEEAVYGDGGNKPGLDGRITAQQMDIEKLKSWRGRTIAHVRAGWTVACMAIGALVSQIAGFFGSKQ